MTNDFGNFGLTPPAPTADTEAASQPHSRVTTFLAAVNPWPRIGGEGFLTDEELRLLKTHLQNGAAPS